MKYVVMTKGGDNMIVPKNANGYIKQLKKNGFEITGRLDDSKPAGGGKRGTV